MRIRSIRPEFWASEDIAALTWDQRLIYIGLWSYVDDNGVGRDVTKLIAADLFPLEEDTAEVVRKIAGALTEYSRRKMITRYEVGNKRYLHISSWQRHQKINRPSEGRYPLPTREDAVIHIALTEPSLSPQAIAPLGEGEKGRRGEGDSATRAASPAETDTAQTIVAGWIDGLKSRPPQQVIGQISKSVKGMLEEGIPADDIRRGLGTWQRKRLHPSTLPSVVHEVREDPADLSWQENIPEWMRG